MASTVPSSPRNAQGMFQYAHIFVRLYSRLSDDEHVVVMTIDPGGEAILVTVMSRTCRCYEARLSSSEMKMIKDTVNPSIDVPWGVFFDLIQRCFVDRSMTLVAQSMKLLLVLKHERPESLGCPPFTATIEIPLQMCSPQEGVITKQVNGMLTFLSLRSGDRRESDKIDALIKRDEQLREEAGLVEAEVAMLRDGLQQFRVQKEAAERQIAELQKQLEINGIVDNTSTDATVNTDHPSVLCRVPKRWIEKAVAFKIPKKLFRAIKIKWPFTVFVTKGLPPPTIILQDVKGSPDDSMALSANDSMTMDPTYSLQHAPTRGDYLRYCDIVAVDADTAMPALSKDEDAVFAELCHLDEWSFNVYEFDTSCHRISSSLSALVLLGYTVFMRLGICARFNISESALVEWLCAVERGYRDVPFHNALHAADALHTIYYVLAQADLPKKARLTDVQVLAAVIAAVLIDFDHPGSGITNRYIRLASPSYASMAYAGQATLERHHVAAGFELMKGPRMNLLECLSADAVAELQALVAHLVLATDLERHDTVVAACSKTLSAADFGMVKEDGTVLLLLALKAADMGFAAKSEVIYSFWVHRLLQELSELGQLERSAGLLVTGLPPDAQPEEKVSLQLNFLNYIVAQTYAMLSDILVKMRATGELIRANKNFWAQT